MNEILRIENLHKGFDNKAVLKGVNLNLQPGAVMGLLGANGAGKTTLLQTAIGLLKADKGHCEILGENSWDMPVSVKQRIGFVAQKQDTFEWMRGGQFLSYLAAFYDKWDKPKVSQLVADWQIDSEQKIAKMSEGQKQKLAIVAAMGHNPDLLILDEPVASLDPSARRAFIQELIELNAEQDTSILFSTHITSDIERVAAQVAILKEGKIYYQGDLDDLKEQVVRLHLSSQQALPENLPINGILQQQLADQQAKLVVENFTPDSLNRLNSLGIQVQVEPLSLEDIFLELNR